ncbi:sensor histidine kinase [Eggerthella sinensis]|uniref:sensor histidine kinase n=1 Tax=Eggerthella sinensis TaxID=242230 RepID=UPI0022E31C2A|nr:HAMP domain-containing sensor histidine kinase [Eggerthella sinensis]
MEESQRLARLSERILALSKMEATAIVPHVERVDVAEQIRRAVLLLEPAWAKKDVRIELSLDECSVPGNADYLVQLWTNLVDNAVKFSPEGGSVNVALYGGRAGEEGREGARDEVVCWVSDEGCGMDAETRRRLFEKFFQGDTSHASEGSGLGLALCKRIVDLHQGTIDVQSSPGRGTVFEVRLPATEGRC